MKRYTPNKPLQPIKENNIRQNLNKRINQKQGNMKEGESQKYNSNTSNKSKC